MSNLAVESKKEAIIDFTNDRLKVWYAEAKASYGVDGYGEARFLKNDDAPLPSGEKTYDFVVKYHENGEDFIAVYTIIDEYIMQNPVDWLYNVWQEIWMEDSAMRVLNLTEARKLLEQW